MAKANEKKLIELPVLPLRDVVVYPHMIIPLFVVRAKSIRALEESLKKNKKVPPEILTSLNSIEDPERLAYSVAAHITLKIKDKQELLENPSLSARIQHLLSLIESEIDLLQIEKRIRGRVRSQMEKSQ